MEVFAAAEKAVSPLRFATAVQITLRLYSTSAFRPRCVSARIPFFNPVQTANLAAEISK
jgi:hypothetical protein